MRRYDFKEGGTSYLPEHPEGRFVLYTGLEQALASSRREGWEQAKAEAKMLSFSYSCHKDIAAMEYKGESK